MRGSELGPLGALAEGQRRRASARDHLGDRVEVAGAHLVLVARGGDRNQRV